MTQSSLEKALAMIDAANSEDPNIDIENTQEWPKELLYSHRMSDMLERFKPNTDDAIKLAIHAQHIQRWKSPRDAYPKTREGYFKWRTELYTFHANTVAKILEEVGYAEEDIERVKQMVGKRGIKSNPDTQLLEDIANLVFIEHYMLDFAQRHPEYDEEKWLNIIRKTWRKMSEQGQQFALAGKITLPEPLIPLIKKAVAS